MGLGTMARTINDFDGKALFAALDGKRQAEHLTWTELANSIWDLATDLNAARNAHGMPNHPISVSTIKNLDKMGACSCQHALFYLRWLDLAPENFLTGLSNQGKFMPICDTSHRPRWRLKDLYAAMNKKRQADGLTWQLLSEQLHCTANQLTALKTAKFATGIKIALCITQWLERPAADFIYPARW